MQLFEPEPQTEACFCPSCGLMGLHLYADDEHLICRFCDFVFSVPDEVIERNSMPVVNDYIDS